MAIIDSRLKDCDTDQDVTENFNRVLNIVDESISGDGDYIIKLVTMTTEDNTTTVNLTPAQYNEWLSENRNVIVFVNGYDDYGYHVSYIQHKMEEDDTYTIVIDSNEYVSTSETEKYKIQ